MEHLFHVVEARAEGPAQVLVVVAQHLVPRGVAHHDVDGGFVVDLVVSCRQFRAGTGVGSHGVVDVLVEVFATGLRAVVAVDLSGGAGDLPVSFPLVLSEPVSTVPDAFAELEVHLSMFFACKEMCEL